LFLPHLDHRHPILIHIFLMLDDKYPLLRHTFLDFGIIVLNYLIVWQHLDDLGLELVLEFEAHEDKEALHHDTTITPINDSLLLLIG
jgi:hypothetical protein